MSHLSLDSLRHLIGQLAQAGGVGASGPYSGHMWKEAAVSVRAAPADHPAWSHGRPGEEEGDGREAGAGGWGCPRRWETGAMEPGDSPALDPCGCRSGWDQHYRRQPPEGIT